MAQDDDDPSAQLRGDLHSAASDALRTRRPILHHLNPDTSWLLQIPRPEDDIVASNRFFFNILIDPWLSGSQSDVASWFSNQTHATPCAIPDISSAESLLRNVEHLAAQGTGISIPEEGTLIDAVAISHEFTDHCHRETLLQVPPSVPVYATSAAAKLIASWSHFLSVQTVPGFSPEHNDWRSLSLSPLPSYISISRVVTEGDALYYHSALLITFSSDTKAEGEGVIYTPHGVHASDLECLSSADPPIAPLAFLHGLHDVHLPKKQLNLGAPNGLKAQRLLGARYWIGTHDEVKRGGGLVSWFLGRKAWTLREALEAERKEQEGGEEEGTNWLELGNGESKVLV